MLSLIVATAILLFSKDDSPQQVVHREAALDELSASKTRQANADTLKKFRSVLEKLDRPDKATTLREMLWLYDEGMAKHRVLVTLRNTMLLEQLGRFSEGYPDARNALLIRQQDLVDRLSNSQSDLEAARDYFYINKALGENDKTFHYILTLSTTDKRRKAIARKVFEVLVEQRRYAEAITVLGYLDLSAAFEQSLEIQKGLFQTGRVSRLDGTAQILQKTSKSVEALAGSGDTKSAIQLAQKLVDYNPSKKTHQLLKEAAQRASSTEFLEATMAIIVP